MEFVKTGLRGKYKRVGQDDDWSHMILTKEELTIYTQDLIDGEKRKARNEIEKTKSSMQQLEKQLDEKQHTIDLLREHITRLEAAEATKKATNEQHETQVLREEIARLEGLNADLERISRERANSDRKISPKKTRSGYLVISTVQRKKDSSARIRLWQTTIQTPYNSDFTPEVVQKQVMHDLSDNSQGDSLLDQMGIDKIYEKSDYYETMRSDRAWCPKPDDYNIALQPLWGLRHDYWEIVFLHTKQLKKIPMDLRKARIKEKKNSYEND